MYAIYGFGTRMYMNFKMVENGPMARENVVNSRAQYCGQKLALPQRTFILKGNNDNIYIVAHIY